MQGEPIDYLGDKKITILSVQYFKTFEEFLKTCFFALGEDGLSFSSSRFWSDQEASEVLGGKRHPPNFTKQDQEHGRTFRAKTLRFSAWGKHFFEIFFGLG